MSAGEATIPDPDPERTSTETTSPDEAKRFQRDDPAAATILSSRRQRHRLHTPESWALALVDHMLALFQPDDTTAGGVGMGSLDLVLFRLEDGTMRLWLQRESDGSDFGPRLTIQPKP